MRAPRLALCALTLATTLVVPATAEAASCNKFSDPAGDARGSTTFDILGGDVTFARKTVVGTLSLTTAKPSDDPTAVLGGRWTVNFTVSGVRYELWRAIAMQTGTITNGLTIAGTASQTKPTVKIVGKTISWSIPRSVVKAVKTPVCGAYGWTYSAGLGADYAGS